jgi:hypothetical protein
MTRLVFILLMLAAVGIGVLLYVLGRRLGREKAMDEVAKTYGDRLLGGPAPNESELTVWGEALANADGSSRQEIIAKLGEGDAIELVRHPGEADRNAIAVVSEKGEIGRLTQADAATLAPYLDRGGRVHAQVSAIRGGTRDNPELNVWILVRAIDPI